MMSSGATTVLVHVAFSSSIVCPRLLVAARGAIDVADETSFGFKLDIELQYDMMPPNDLCTNNFCATLRLILATHRPSMAFE